YRPKPGRESETLDLVKESSSHTSQGRACDRPRTDHDAHTRRRNCRSLGMEIATSSFNLENSGPTTILGNVYDPTRDCAFVCAALIQRPDRMCAYNRSPVRGRTAGNLSGGAHNSFNCSTGFLY